MRDRLKTSIVSLVVGAFLAACASTPPPVEISPAEFQNIIGQASASESVVRVDRDLSALLARPAASVEQKAQAHYLRGHKRWHSAYNLPGALADFERFVALAPLDERVEETRAIQITIAEDIRTLEQRLAGLQTLENWFDDKVAMGQLDEAAGRQRRSGLAPNVSQTDLLREAGYICVDGASAPGTQPVHQHGDNAPEHVIGLVWCSGDSKA